MLITFLKYLLATLIVLVFLFVLFEKAEKDHVKEEKENLLEVDGQKFIQAVEKSADMQRVNKLKKENKQKKEKLNAKQIVDYIIEVDDDLYEIFGIDIGLGNDLTVLDKMEDETDNVYYKRVRDILYDLLKLLEEQYREEGVESKFAKELLDLI